MKRFLAGLLAFLLLLFLVPGLVLYWLAATEPGLRWLLRETSARISAVAVERVEGALLEGFILHGLVYQSSAIEVRLAELDVRWEPRALWRRRLHFRSIRAQGLQVSLKGEEGGSEPPAWPQWNLPLDIAIDDARLTGGGLRTAPGAEPISLERLDAALRLAREGLTVARFEVALPRLEAGLSGSVGFTGERTVTLKTTWTLALAGRPELKAVGAVSGNPERLEIRQSLEAPVPAELTAVLSDPLDTLGWTAQLNMPRFSPNRIDPAWKPWPLALALQGRGTLAEAALSGDFSAELPEVGEARGQLQARYRAPGEVAVEALDLALPGAGTDFHLEGKADKLPEHPEFTVSARWRNLVWPPSPHPGPAARSKPGGTAAPWRSPEGRLNVAGRLEDFRFDAEGKLQDFRVQAGGNIGIEPDRTVFRGIRVLGAGAKAAVDGVLGPRLDFAWTLEAADLGLWAPGAKGRVQSHGVLRGTRTAPEAEAELVARGLRYEGNGVDALELDLKAGLQPDSPFVLNLSADDLSAAGQRLDIALAGQGTRARHRLTGRITSSPGANWDGGAGPGGVSPRDGTSTSSPGANLAGRSPALAPSPREGASQGAAAGREVIPRSQAEPPSRLDFVAEGGFRDADWAGSVARFDFTVPPAGRWDLRRPAALRLGAEGGGLDGACWSGEGTDACLDVKFAAAGEWRLAAELSRLPLARFRDVMPQGAAMAGLLNATARFSGKGGLIGEGRLVLDVAEARLDYRADGEGVLRFEPRPLTLEALVSGRGSELSLVAEQPGVASIHGRASLEGALDPARLKQARLAGSVQAYLQNLGLLDPFLPQVEKLQGGFNADLRFAGTASAPMLKLEATVPDAGFALPQLGIKVRNVNLRATTGEDGTVAVQGRAVSGSGEIGLTGEATLSGEAGWPMHLNVTGNRFLAADIPEAKVYVSPDLGISFEQGRLMLKGKMTVPEASLRAPERPGAVKPSGDVVLVGAEAPPEKPGLPIETHVDVILGNKIQVQGAGFKGRVDGHVFIDQDPNGPVLGTGQIGVREGKYELYGVELAVDDGRLLFARSPIENPGLDLNATRRVDNVLAGVRVLGTVNKPNVTLYSDPVMPQTDILAYLVTGKPFGLASQQEGGLLQGAAMSLGGSAGSFLAKEVSSRLGLGGLVDISVQSSLSAQGFPQGYRTGPASAQSTALFLGRYLTPRLYVQYGMGLFQNAYVFRVRYDLAKHWKVQTETGQYSGGDILYQWEK